MIARIRPLSHFNLALILLVVLAIVLFLSHPAARTAHSSLGLELASLESMEFKIGEEEVDGEALYKFYSAGVPVWSGSDQAGANARAEPVRRTQRIPRS